MADSHHLPPLDPPELSLAEKPSAASVWWRSTGQWVLATLVVVALAWFTYTREGWVPLLSGADLGIHEAGHLFFAWAPRPLVALGGTLLQLAVPALLGVYFWRRREPFAATLMVAWVAENLNNVSVYLYDAPRKLLPLFGDTDGTASGHDWAYLLGPGVLNAMGAADAIAYFVRALSAAVFLGALALALWPLVAPRFAAARDAAESARLAERRRTLPVREPRNPVRGDSDSQS